MLEILEATQAEYGHLPVAALKMISQKTGAWYAMIYGTASYYRHLRFEPPAAEPLAAATATARATRETSFLAGLNSTLMGRAAGEAGAPGSTAGTTASPAPGAGPARA
jgi:hypothetical protein